jgi:hypothetical protein
MGLGIFYTRLKDGDFRGVSTEILSEVAPDNQAIWLQGFHNSSAKARVNLASGASLAVVGDPEVNEDSVEFVSGTSYYETDILETSLFSAFHYGANDGAALGCVLGSFVGSADPGVFWYWSAAGTLRAQVAQGANVVRSLTLVVANPTQKKRFSLICEASALTLYNETDLTSATISIADTRDVGTQPLRVGSSRSTSGAVNGGTSISYHTSFFTNLAMTSLQRSAHWAQVTRWTVASGVVENTA